MIRVTNPTDKHRIFGTHIKITRTILEHLKEISYQRQLKCMILRQYIPQSSLILRGLFGDQRKVYSSGADPYTPVYTDLDLSSPATNDLIDTSGCCIAFLSIGWADTSLIKAAVGGDIDGIEQAMYAITLIIRVTNPTDKHRISLWYTHQE